MRKLSLRLARFPDTVAVRLALGYGVLVIASMTIIAVLLYFGTVGVLSRGIDRKLTTISSRLTDYYQSHGSTALQQEIQRLLVDGIDSDTEVYLLAGPDGRAIVGNLSVWPEDAPFDRLTDQDVTRIPDTIR